jgi:hypothetical protein
MLKKLKTLLRQGADAEMLNHLPRAEVLQEPQQGGDRQFHTLLRRCWNAQRMQIMIQHG